MIALAPFKREDWYGFASASRFADGSEPLLGWFKVIIEGIELHAGVIVDAEGLTVFVQDSQGEDVLGVAWSGPYAARTVASLHTGMSQEELRAMPGADVHLDAVDAWFASGPAEVLALADAAEEAEA